MSIDGNGSSTIYEKLLEKSVEAFIVGIEIYNKPTIKYRIEGFSFFICNAWELTLKAHMINTKGEKSIYYKDNPNRTLSLENCVKEVFTNHKDPLRLNLEKIIELRNTSTHFVTVEYEMIYIPLFQSCVLNFSEKLMEFHNYDITTVIPQNFLTLNVSMRAIENSVIIAKYPEEIAQKIIEIDEEISELSTTRSPEFSIVIEHRHLIVKDRSKATSLVGIDNSSDAKVKIVKELKDPAQTHPYNAKKCIHTINDRIKRLGIDMKINQYIFQLFVNYYSLKLNERYHYLYQIGNTTLHSYSQQTVDLIVNEIQKDAANIVEHMKEHFKKI